MGENDNIPEDHKMLALRFLSDEQLQKVLDNQSVAEAHKAEVMAEIERRRIK